MTAGGLRSEAGSTVRHGRAGAQRDSGRPYDRLGRLRTGWIAILLVTLFAFASQCFVTETHVHFAPDGYAAAHVGKGGAIERPSVVLSTAEQPGECPICDEIAHSGHLLLPTAIALPAPDRAAPLLAETPSFAQLPPARSHGWRSRAPPQPLQA